MIKIVTIIGARPQFVKAAAISREISKRENFKEVIVHTGQHFDKNMSDIFFEEMSIPTPDYNLAINSLGHGAMTGRMLEGIEDILKKEEPQFVMVYGDTNSTIAGALAAKKMHIKVIHIEAGLRSFNMNMPEEINRILTDRISDLLFCPTQTAIDNLNKEGYDNIDTTVIRSGDVMEDAAMFYALNSAEKSTVIKKFGLSGKEFILCTIHRQENTDDPQKLGDIISALNQINEETEVVCPLHPRTVKLLKQHGLEATFTVIDPVGYFDMIELLKGCKFVMTDSGGLQKEAYFFKKPAITMREETEWVELVKNGYNQIVGSDKDLILKAIKNVNFDADFEKDLYGKGQACKVIVDNIDKFA